MNGEIIYSYFLFSFDLAKPSYTILSTLAPNMSVSTISVSYHLDVGDHGANARNNADAFLSPNLGILARRFPAKANRVMIKVSNNRGAVILSTPRQPMTRYLAMLIRRASNFGGGSVERPAASDGL